LHAFVTVHRATRIADFESGLVPHVENTPRRRSPVNAAQLSGTRAALTAGHRNRESRLVAAARRRRGRTGNPIIPLGLRYSATVWYGIWRLVRPQFQRCN
jgi:hypothetical protein